MAKEIGAEELKKWIDEGKDFYLVDVLSEESYEGRHLPSALNVPYSGDNFVKDIKDKLGVSDNDNIVVYCSSKTCLTSPTAAAKLEDNNFTNVSHFKGGLAGWQDAGYEFEGEATE